MFRKIVKQNRRLYIAIREYVMCWRKFRFNWSNVSRRSWVVSSQRYIAKDVVIGDFGFVGRGCTIYPRVRIGRFCLIAPEVAIIGADHKYDQVGMPICFSGREELPETIIGEDVWIGMSSKIMVGTRIGNCAIIAAASVVTKDVPEFAIVGGVPARIIGYRFEAVEDQIKHLNALSVINEYGQLVQDLSGD